MNRIVGVAALALLLGCSHGEESECSKYISLLGGENPAQVFDKIADKECQDALPVLKEMFDPKKGQYNKEILRVVSDIWNPDERLFKLEAEKFTKKKPLYIEILRLALQSPETAMVAAGNAKEWGLGELRADLLNLLQEDVRNPQPQFTAAYGAVLGALSIEAMGGFTPELEDIYVSLLNNSPDAQGVEVNKLCAQALGSIKSKNPEGIKALVKGMFLVSKDGGTVFKESVEALYRVGRPAVPFLLDVIRSKPGDEKVRYMEEFAVKNALSEWKWRRGMRIPMVLAQLRDQRAAQWFVTDMGLAVIEPANLPDALKQDWTIEQTNRIKFDSWALMSVANKGIMEEALRTMRNRNVEGNARLQLALALSFAYTPEAAETLLAVSYEPELDEDNMTEEAIAKEEERRKWLGDPAKESDFVIRFLQPLAYAVGYNQISQFNDIFVDGFDENFGDQEKPEDIQEKLDQIDIKVLLAVPTACKQDLECYKTVFVGGAGRLEGNPDKYEPESVKGIDDRETEYVKAMARAKAGLILSRWTGSAKKTEILKLFIDEYAKLPNDDEIYGDLKQIILLGFERLGLGSQREAVNQLRELMAAEDKKGGAEATKAWTQRIEALTFWLETYEEPAEAPAKSEAGDKGKAPEKPAAAEEEAAPADEAAE